MRHSPVGLDAPESESEEFVCDALWS